MKHVSFLIVIFMTIFLSPFVFSFSFQPLSMDFTPSGKGSIRTFKIENDSEKPIAVKVSMQTREMKPDGTEINRDASGSFVIYPPQVILQPGAYQAIRVQWVGSQDIDTEKAFRIIAEQLPVRFEQEERSGGSINIMVRYKGSVYVVPPKAKPNIDVLSVYQAMSDDQEKLLSIEVENSGTAHTILQDLTVTITLKENEKTLYVLDKEELEGMRGENILSQSVRTFFLPWPNGLRDGDLDAELDFIPEW